MESTNAPARDELLHGTIHWLIRTMRLHHKVIEHRMEGLGIHRSQHTMLMQLARMGRAASQKDIAQALDVSPACVARTLKALNAAQLIDKSDGADGRCREIGILPAGERIIADSHKTFRDTDAEMFDGISDEEVRRFSETLSRLYENLCRMDNTP